MDLGDVSARKLHNGGFTFDGVIRQDEHFHSSRFGLRKRVREIRHFISHDLPAVGIPKVTVRHQHGQLAELRFDPDSPVGFCWPANLDTWSQLLVGKDTSVREVEKAAHERPSSVP